MTTIDHIRMMLVKEFKLDPSQLTPDARLDDLGIDSLGMAELVFNIEDAFKLSVPDAAVGLTTLGEVVRFIDGLIATRDNGAMPPLSPGQAP